MYFDSYRIECIPQDVLNKIKYKSVTHNIQSDDSIMSGFYCIAFIEYMTVEKILLVNTNLISHNDYKKNEKIICKYFKDKYGKKNAEP